MPTLLTFGENETMPISTAKIMQKKIPNSRLVTTPDGGHHHMVDNPDVYYKHLADFIREVENGTFKGEDEESVASFVKTELEFEDYQVVWAEDAKKH